MRAPGTALLMICLAPLAAGAAWAARGAAAHADAQEAGPLLAPARLEELLEDAEAVSPVLAAARSRIAAAEAVPSQEEAYPDPVASISWQNESINDFSLGDAPGSSLSFSWMQEVPFPGKRGLRGDVARSEIEIARRRLERERVDLAAAIKRVYADLYRSDRSLSILRENRDLLVAFLETTRVRYETGEGILENVLKARTEVTKIDAEIERTAQERRSTQAVLNALAGREAGRPLGPALDLPEPLPVPETEELEKEALAWAPELLELEAGTRRAERRVDLARKDLRPNLIWGASYATRGDLDPMVAGTFGLRLPLYRDRKQAEAIVQARREAEAAARDVEAARLRLAAEVQDLVARARRASSLETLYAQGIIPQARSALEAAAAAYAAGRVEFLTLLDDFQSILAYEIEFEAQRSDRIAALAGLERLTGRRLIAAGGPEGKRGDHD